MGDYYILNWYIQIAEGVKTYELRKLGKIKKLSKFHRVTA